MKPGAMEPWDILTLNDIIKDKVDTQNRKLKEHKDRLDMKKFYDTQVEAKRQQKQNEKEYD